MIERTISHRLVDLQSTVDDLAADIADIKAMLARLLDPPGPDDFREALGGEHCAPFAYNDGPIPVLKAREVRD